MRAGEGDQSIIHGHHDGDPGREAEILEVHGRDGAPPHLMRWDDGRESTSIPSSDSTSEHRPAERARR